MPDISECAEAGIIDAVSPHVCMFIRRSALPFKRALGINAPLGSALLTS